MIAGGTVQRYMGGNAGKDILAHLDAYLLSQPVLGFFQRVCGIGFAHLYVKTDFKIVVVVNHLLQHDLLERMLCISIYAD